MIYEEAISLIKENPFNLEKIDKDLVDLKLLRFVRRYHVGAGAWAVTAYAPKNLKDKVEIWLDSIINFPVQFGFEDISIDKTSK